MDVKKIPYPKLPPKTIQRTREPVPLRTIPARGSLRDGQKNCVPTRIGTLDRGLLPFLLVPQEEEGPVPRRDQPI